MFKLFACVISTSELLIWQVKASRFFYSINWMDENLYVHVIIKITFYNRISGFILNLVVQCVLFV